MKCQTCGANVHHLASHAMQKHASYMASPTERQEAIKKAYGEDQERRLPINRRTNPVGVSHWLLDRRHKERRGS